MMPAAPGDDFICHAPQGRSSVIRHIIQGFAKSTPDGLARLPQ
jgi:hypothetical protein